MNLRSMGMYVPVATAILASATLSLSAQVNGRAQSSSASQVAAEVTKGKLSPGDSKPGDTIALRLKDDVKSNGEVVLKKGTIITGVVRNVKRAEAKEQAQSMMQIEWLAPAVQGKAAESLSIALQSVKQVNPIYQHEQDSASDAFGLGGAAATSTAVARPARTGGSSVAGGGLLGSAVGDVLGSTTSVATTTVATVDGPGSTAAIASSSSTRASGQSNAALRSMPSVIAADYQTSSAIDNSLGTPSAGQLFKVGHGQLVTANGSQQSVDLFSHLNNDTVITSQGKDFEISNGAQMQLLVGVNRK